LNRHGRFWNIVGIIATVAGAVWLVVRFAFVFSGVPVAGVVESVEQRSDTSIWYARFTYGDLEGRRHTAEMSFLSPTFCPSITVGNSVPVRYSRNDPDDALIVTPTALWLYPGIVLAGGLLLRVIGRVLRLAAQWMVEGKFRPEPKA